MSFGIQSSSMGNFGGSYISPEHGRIISELLALGIQPSYDYQTDKAKLNAALSKKTIKTQTSESTSKLKETSKTEKTAQENIQANNYDKTQTQELPQTSKVPDITGAMNISNLNKTFLVKKYQP